MTLVMNERGEIKRIASGQKLIRPKIPNHKFSLIELCLNLLKNGGRMAIVLPDGIFGNPTDGYIRE